MADPVREAIDGGSVWQRKVVVRGPTLVDVLVLSSRRDESWRRCSLTRRARQCVITPTRVMCT